MPMSVEKSNIAWPDAPNRPVLLSGVAERLRTARTAIRKQLRISVAAGHSIRFLVDGGNGRTWTPGSSLVDTRNSLQQGIDSAASICHVGWPAGW